MLSAKSASRPLQVSPRLRRAYLAGQNSGQLTEDNTTQKRCVSTSLNTVATTKKITRSQDFKSISELPGPKGLPIIGTLWDYIRKGGFGFNKMFEAMESRGKEFGPIYKEQIAHITSVVISDPEEYVKVVQADGKYPHRIALEPMAYYRTQQGMGLGVVNSQGEEWYRQRTVLNKKMLRPKEMLDYVEGMDTVATDFIKRIGRVKTNDGTVVNMEFEIFKWALESIGTVLFEDRIGCFKDPAPEIAQEFIHNLLGFFKYLQPLMYNVPVYKIYPTKTWRRFETYANNVTSIGQRFVDKKVKELQKQETAQTLEWRKNNKMSFLAYLLTHKSLTPKEANNHAIELLMGAVETTSNATIWTLYLLAKNPRAQEALYREIMTICPNKEPITAEKLQDLPYVKACLKETFRLYPITFATSRILHEDLEVGGYLLPPGTHVQANLYGMGRDPKLFPNPESYLPERWMRENFSTPIKAGASLPWGHGARMCLGRRLAEQEIYILLSKVVQNFRLGYSEEDVKPVLNTVMTPDRPVKVEFTARQ